MTIIAILCAVGAYGELYVALDERSPWVTLSIALVLAFLSNAAARTAVTEAAVGKKTSRLQHITMRAISHRITRSLSVLAPMRSLT